MKKIILFILMMLPVAVFGQGMTFNHDSSVMNQFTVGETGVGSFTPELYYDLFHNSYSDGARMTNKQAFRTEMQLTLHKQEPMAEKLDSALTHRMRVEMMNIADRTPGVTDIAWQVERGKIEGKLAILKRNIERITINGGSVQSYREWIVRYNCIQCGIDAIRNAYLSQGSRKEQYIAIYRDILQKNVEVCAYLNYLNSEKMTKDLQSSTKAVHPIDTSQVARIARASHGRWKMALAAVSGGTDFEQQEESADDRIERLYDQTRNRKK